MTASDAVERGRASFARRAWGDAYAQFSVADRDESLDPEDLERLAIAAHLIGREAESGEIWARAHQAFLSRDNVERAARCAFWLALFGLLMQGDLVLSGGWLARGRRLLDQDSRDCAEHGYLLVPAALRLMYEGDATAAQAAFVQAAAIGERFGERDLLTFGQLGPGRRCSDWDRSPTVSPCSMRSWWRSRPGTCHRSLSGSSTAPCSRNARRSSICVGHRRGQPRLAAGAPRSPTSFPIADSASFIAPN